MNELVRPILVGLETANFSIGLQLGKLPNEDALRQARGEQGCSITWVVGHLLDYRCNVLTACGVDYPNPYAELYAYDNPPSEESKYADITELHRAWDVVHAKLTETLSELTQEELQAEPERLPSPGGGQCLLDALAFMVWHEAYHIGAIGLLRVQWGHRHTHELAIEAMKSQQG